MMDLLLATSGGEAQVAGGGYVDDVFSAYTYTGNGSTQTINNGIDLAGKGGLVWLKGRSGATDHALYDTLRGATFDLASNSSAAQTTQSAGLTAFGNTGFSIGSLAKLNTSAATYASWTFRRAPKFFDVVTYTGNGASNRTLSHQLNADVGMVMVKATSTTGDWWVFHRSATGDLVLNTTAAQTASKANIPSATSSTFTVNGSANTNGVTYVAYLWAHDPSADGIIQCGSYVGNATIPHSISLGWEPQYFLIKNASSTSGWQIYDVSRGMPNNSSGKQRLYANTSDVESTTASDYIYPNQTGFTINTNAAEINNNGNTFIYLAIRRSNKPPTSGTQVYNAIARTGTGAAATVTGVGFAPDFVVARRRITNTIAGFVDRLRGRGVASYPNQAAVEVISDATQDITAFLMDGISVGTLYNYGANPNGDPIINHFFRRAKGFFDVVCDSGTGVAHGITHGLSVAPEFIIRKSRSGATQWECWHSALVTTEKLVLNSTAAKVTDATAWNSTLPTSTQFSVGTGANVNTNAATYVTYLFATLAGISKVGSYTGNGTSQTINCGFATGARFILIKRTDATGDWYVWDSVRGIIAANDPYLSLNAAATEVTTDDSVDPDASGFIVNQNTATNINVNRGQYIFLAIA